MITKKRTASIEALRELSLLGQQVEEDIKSYDSQTDKWWDTLSEEQKHKAFYSVMKRVSDGETQGFSYRKILYSVFGFGKDSYSLGMSCGFFNLHQMFEPNTREVTKLKIEAAFNACGIEKDRIDWDKINRVLHWDINK
jgi:hypothetical protein